VALVGGGASGSGAKAGARWDGELPGEHYKWLLGSPLRPYLSTAAEFYLQLKYGGQVTFPGLEHPGEEESIWGLNVRINDRAQDENPSLTTQSETAVAVFGSNVVVGWNDIGQFFQTGSITGYGYSTDGGQTFRDAGVIPPPKGGANLGDPDIAVDSRGVFYFSQISISADGVAFIGVSRSEDGGRTFTRPVSASWSVDSPDSFQDKEFITADNTGSRYDGNVYVSWTRFSREGARIYFARSTDGGRSFERAIPLSPPGHFVQGSIPRVGPSGEVYVAWEDFTLPGIVVVRSTDGGRTFSSPVLAAPVKFVGQEAPPATCQGRRILNGYIDAGFEFPSMAVNPLNGEVYIVFDSNPPGIDQADVYFVRSSDGGQTWSEPMRLNDDRTTNDQFMPAITVAPDGTIAVIWYDRRNDPANLKIDLYMAASNDGGRTWRPNKRVTTVTFGVPPLGPNFDRVRPCYMGDYIDITADAQNFYLAWGDNRERGLTWRTLPDMPTPREATANAAIGQAIFAVGGTKLGFREAGDSDANEAFNTRTGRWVKLAPMPTPRSAAAAVSYGLSLYVVGGQSSKYGGVSGAFERYDVLTNRWTKLPQLPTPRAFLGAARVGSKIYAIGGQDCVSLFCGHTLDTVEIYDIATGRWTAGPPLPEPRAAFATAVIEAKIYVIGGYNAQTDEVYSSILALDPLTGEWTWVADLPEEQGRVFPSAGVCDGKLVVFDGLSERFSLRRRDAWLYDAVTGHWEQIAGPKFARIGVQAVNVGGVLYAIGGSSSSRVRHSGAHEAFDCRQLGFLRPDPDVFFTIEPIAQFRTLASQVSSAAPSEARAKRPRALTVRATRALLSGVYTFRTESLMSGAIESIRLRIYSLDGRVVYDSGPRRGPTVQWNLQTQSGAVAANGIYLYVITARDREGQLVRSPARLIVVLR
jgi:N-acetylneuraminic acid mutarotase